MTHLIATHPLYQGRVEDYGPFVQALIVHAPTSGTHKSALLIKALERDGDDSVLRAKLRVESWWRVL